MAHTATSGFGVRKEFDSSFATFVRWGWTLGKRGGCYFQNGGSDGCDRFFSQKGTKETKILIRE